MKKWEEYKLMLEASKPEESLVVKFFRGESVFTNVPRDVVTHIARLRIEATLLAQPNPHKQSETLLSDR